MRHRPIGIGIQGLADAFIKMKIAFEDPRADVMNA
jgi:ribonucleoside-diphosphate reductase alpha chain